MWEPPGAAAHPREDAPGMCQFSSGFALGTKEESSTARTCLVAQPLGAQVRDFEGGDHRA